MQELAGTLLQPRSAERCEIIPQALIRIGDDGRIAETGTGPGKTGKRLGGPGCWLIPGFIDAHLHLPQWDRRGVDGLPVRAWREQVVYPAEARFEDPALAEKLTEDFVSSLIAHGTTTVAAFGSPFAEATDRSFKVFARRGFRAIYGQMLNDVNCPAGLCQQADKALDESRMLAAAWHGAENGRLSYAFSPRMPGYCSERLMRGAAALAKMLKCYVQTHVAESTAEVHAVRQRFPDNVDDVDVLAEAGLLTPRTLLGHGVFLDHSQRRQVANAGTALVHCPTANLFLESGLMDYVAHRAAGIRIALGSSVAGGYEMFMPQVAVQCLNTAKTVKVHALPRRSHTVPSPAEAWWLLTRGAAEALGMADRIGSLEPGFDADLLVVRPEPWIAQLPTEQQVSALLYTLKPHQIEQVFVAGRRMSR